MADSLVVQLMRRFKADLLAREADQMWVMAQRWLEIEQAVGAQVDLLARELAAEREAGRSASQGKLYRMERYQTLLAQLRREVGLYTNYAVREITDRQRQYATFGIDHTVQSIRASYTGIGPYFEMLPVGAVENMAGQLGNGAPLSELLSRSWPDSADALTKALLKGTALGWNPTRTAAEMRRGMATGLNRALTIARTEQMRVYREAGRAQYEASGVVDGFYRIAAHDSRTCIACLVTEGEFYPVRESLRDHVNGRCSTVPKVRGMPAPQWEHGKAWFTRQPAAMQAQIMGRNYYDAWKSGQYRLDDLPTVKHNETWGDSVQVTPLNELTRAAETAA